MLRTPAWSMTEYSCLSDSLAGPEAMLRRQGDNAELATLQARLAELVGQGSRGAALQTEIEEQVLAIVRTNSEKEARRKFLRHWAETYRERRRQERLIPGAVGTGPSTSAIHQVRDLYSSFNVKQFREDFADAFADEIGEADPVKKQIAELTTAIADVTKRLTPWKVGTVREWFRDGVPRRWRDYHMEVLGETVMAETILKLFIHDWRSRAPMFQEPVTVCGVAIRCLPTERREATRKLYEQMGLGALRKVPVFQPVVLDIPDDAPEVSSLPGKFGLKG